MAALEGCDHFVRAAEPLARYTWLGLGGPAQYFAEPTTHEELAHLLSQCNRAGLPVHVLGGGSNVLVRDQGVEGVVIWLSAPVFTEIHVEGQRIRAGGGARLGHVISTAAREGLAGLEALVGIPGTVGGALHNNSDSHGTSIGQWTTEVRAMTLAGERLTYHRGDLQFGYRHSNLDPLLVLEGTFQLEKEDPATITRRMQKLWIVRRSNQPPGHVGHGRMFKDPQGIDAASLIEQAGMKGARVGGAEVFAENPNFVVVHAGATSDDIRTLMDQIRDRVEEQTAVELQPELQIW